MRASFHAWSMIKIHVNLKIAYSIYPFHMTFKQSLLAFLLAGSLVVLGMGCGDTSTVSDENPDPNEVNFMSPILNWPDITIPVGAELTQSSDPDVDVENHRFTLKNTTLSKFLTNIENGMSLNGWKLNSSREDGRQFIKNKNLVTFDARMNDQGGVDFTVIIEPSGVYGES